MPSWPAGLPQFVDVTGYQEEPPPTVLRSQPDAGPAKQRRRATAGAEPIKIVVMLTKAERATFISFHRDTIGHGALSFDWVHPVTRTASTLRIVGGAYRLSAVSGKFYRLDMDIEVLP